MKNIFEEAEEEYLGRDIRVPHHLIGYECPECFSKVDFRCVDNSYKFKCKKCGCEADLQMVITKRGDENV